jgi:hypothetical protein
MLVKKLTSNRWFWAVLILATLVRAGLFVSVALDYRRAMTPDSGSYVDLAENLKSHGAFTQDLLVPSAPQGRAEIFRTPGYPVFLMSGGWWYQPVFDVMLVFVTMLLALRLLNDERLAILAGLWQAVTPVAAAASVRVLSDSIYAFLLTAAVLCIVVCLQNRHWWAAVTGAIVMAMACYVRPAGLFAATVMAGAMILARGSWLRGVVFVMILAACIGPWIARNQIKADYAGFSSVAGDSLHRFTAAEVYAATHGWPVDDARFSFDWEVACQGLPTPGAVARYRRQRAMAIISADRGVALRIHLLGCGAFWLPGATDVLEELGATSGQRGTLAVFHREGILAATQHYFDGRLGLMVLGIGLALVYGAKVAGVLRAVIPGRGRRWSPSPEVWLLVALVAVAAMMGGPASTPRFRVPVSPLLSVAAAAGWGRWLWRGRYLSMSQSNELCP